MTASDGGSARGPPSRPGRALRPGLARGRRRRARAGRGRRLPGPRRGRARRRPRAAGRAVRRRADVDALFERALRIALAAAAERPAELRRLDRRREIDPGWFQRTRMQGYVCYVDRFCGTLAELPGPAGLPRRARHHLPAPHAAAAAAARARTTAATRSMDYRAVDPRLGTMADLEDVAGALHERGMSLCIDLVLNHTAREHRVGAGLAGRRPGLRRLLHRVPRPDDARRLRRDHPGGLPRPGAGLVQLGARGVRRRRRLGLDDVLALPVGPRLHEPRGDAGDARRDHLAGQPRRRRLPDGRRPVHVEAAGHHLPEPAGGPHAAAAAARADPAGRARASSSRPRRSCRRRTWCPTSAATSGTGRSASWPTTTSSWCCCGAAWPPRTPGWPRTRCAACGRSRRPPRGSPTCAGTTTSAGRSATSTPAAVGVERLRAPALPQRLLSAAASPGPSPAGRCSRRTRRPATPGSPGSAASLCGIEDALERGDDAALEAGDPPAGAALLGRLRLRRHPAALHGRRAGPAQRHRLPRRPRARPGQPLDAPPADGLGGGRAAHRPGHAGGPGVRAGCSGSGEARRALPALRGGGECTVLDVGNDAVLAWRRRHPRSGTLRRAWPTSAARRQTVDADTVTGFGTFEPVLTSDGPPELRADRRAPARASDSPGTPSPEREGWVRGGSRQALPSARG